LRQLNTVIKYLERGPKMQDINNIVSILSSDFLYIATFISLSYTIGGFFHIRGIKYPYFNSMAVGIPWFIVLFVFISPTLSEIADIQAEQFIMTPFLILCLASLTFAYIKRNDPLGKYYIETVKLAILKPLISLSVMFVLRDVVQLSFLAVTCLTIFTYILMLILETFRHRLNVSPSGVLYNLAALFMYTLGFSMLSGQTGSAIVPLLGGAGLGIFSVLLYNTSKNPNSITEDEIDLFSRFEELVAEGQFQTAVDMSEDGLWEFQLESDTMTVSKPLQDWLELEKSEIEHAADFWISRVHQQDWNKLPESWIPEDFSSLRNMIRSLSSKNKEFEIRVKCGAGGFKWVRVRFQVVVEGSSTHIHGSFKDVDVAKHAQAQITQLSLYDLTTGLPNFSSLVNHLHEAIDEKDAHAILSLNIDNFKIINDLMGFFTGDEVLAKISKRLMTMLPDYADLYRFGGDEFVIITHKPEQATALAELILSEFNGKMDWKETHLRITCSIGISNFPTAYAHDVESILKCSDIALEQAKNNGKNQYAIFNNSMMDELEQRHYLINALESSHMRENFEIHYQPLITCEQTDKVHVEALLRWTWLGKRISPGEFIPVAEETGLIIPIGKMVFDQVCMDIAYMQAHGKTLCTSVNVSAVQLLHPEFIPSIVQAIEAHCIDAKQITIEITETSLIHDTKSVGAILERLSKMGLRISLDDFGTGFSSLSHIIDLPIDELKLDRTFIHNFHKDAKRQNVIQNIIQLAHGMGLVVVAEGVEVEAECILLKQYGCDVCQGYYYAYPMPLNTLVDHGTQTA